VEVNGQLHAPGALPAGKQPIRLKIFRNRMPRRIFGPKRNEVTGISRKLHNEDLYYSFFTTNITIIMK
jgi:hypothetical protein